MLVIGLVSEQRSELVYYRLRKEEEGKFFWGSHMMRIVVIHNLVRGKVV